MDIASSSKTQTNSRSSHIRHGTLKGSSNAARRPASPDSACENDGEWVSGAICGADEGTSDLSEEGGEKSHSSMGRKKASSLKRKSNDGTLAKAVVCQDSDVDSGIVACRKPGERIGSTSSADTESSQESRHRIEYSPPVQKSELSSIRNHNGTLRVEKRSSCSADTNGPVKGDHSLLKETTRRPPTPLTLLDSQHHCVRFDEQLQLSEQNIRRSCRRLYDQGFFYPRNSDPFQLQGRSTPGSSRNRSRTVPELELRRYSPISVDGQSRHARSHKENVGPVEGRRSSNLRSNRMQLQSPSDVIVGDAALSSLQAQQRKTHHKFPMELCCESRASCLASTDSGIASNRNSSQCTCSYRIMCSSQLASEPQCTCRCCNCVQQSPRATEKAFGLFKSNSCSTLSSVMAHQSRPQLTQFPPRTSKKSFAQSEDNKKAPLQKTPSYSSFFQCTTVPVYSDNNDNMVRAYAHVASVVPDDLRPNSQGGRRAKTLSRIKHNPENLYDTIRSSTSNAMSSKSEPIRSSKRPQSESFNLLTAEVSKDLESLRTELESSKNANAKLCDLDSKSTHSSDIYSQISENSVNESDRRSVRDGTQNRIYGRRRNVGVVAPNCGPNPVYLKSALKKTTQSAMQNISDSSQTAINGEASRLSEVEYAVVDKSRKNRFASLPALNGNIAHIGDADGDKDQPPVPPKKLLHKSDFSLYRSRSSSPKKSLLGRMQTLTRSAKTALQKAFSTERIYRPEREERMEATGQKELQRSKSFIRTLAGSFRKKKRKSRPPMAEVVPQASWNPEWDEQPSGPNSPVHVRGQLLQLNLDGSQVVELTKPPNKPYGFFLVRGRVKNSKGIFVSRMRDQETKKQLAGLLDIGDEILEIGGSNVKDADIMQVNNLMTNKNTLLLTVLPYICRKDI